MPGLRRELYFQVHPEVTGPRDVWEQEREDQANLGTNLHVSQRTSPWNRLIVNVIPVVLDFIVNSTLYI